MVDPRQGTTSYVYDEAGRLIKETLAASTANERVAYTRYNAFGEVTQVLRGEAANQLTTGMTAAQVEQVYSHEMRSNPSMTLPAEKPRAGVQRHGAG